MTAFAQLSTRRFAPVAFALAVLAAPVTVQSAEAAPPGATAANKAQESKLVEYEVSEAVVERLMKWAGWFGFAVGIPLGVLALTLTVLGVRSYRDLQARLADARGEVDRRMAEAADLKTEFAALHERYAQLLELESHVRALSGRVDRVEAEVVGFQASKALTPKLRSVLEATLSRYRAWLSALRFDPSDPVTVLIERQDAPNAYYDAGKIVIDPRIANDPDVVLREYAHHVLRSARGEHDNRQFTAIQSGLADYLPCAFTGNPLFAVTAAPVFNRFYKQQVAPGGYLRTMLNENRLDEDVTEYTTHAVGEGWAGAFWALRGLIGGRETDLAVLQAWTEAEVIDDTLAARTAFARRVAALAAQHAPQSQAAIAEVFARRGLPIAKAARRRSAA